MEVRRSRRRRRTVSAYREGDTVVVSIPATMTATEERRWVAEMLARLERGEPSRRSPGGKGDAELRERCATLAHRWLDGRPEASSVRWVPPMRTRWASCTPVDGTIRVSERLRQAPGWVLDYVLVHELTHLIEAGHGPEFWALVHRYPRAERAIGYLEGLASAAGLDIAGTDGEVD